MKRQLASHLSALRLGVLAIGSAFALATSTGTISLMRGYRLAPLVLGVGLVSAVSVGLQNCSHGSPTGWS